MLAMSACGGGPKHADFGLDERPSNTTCLAHARPVLDTNVTLEPQWTGVNFNQPLFLTQAPGDDTTWYVVQRQGLVRAFPETATSDADTRQFASVTVASSGEGGLLGMAFDPGWPTRREVYLSYTRAVTAGDPAPPTCAGSGNPFTSVIARFTSSDGTSLDSAPDEILKVGQPYTNHDGGNIAFGLDGYLYYGLGDGGNGGDPCGSGQNLDTFLGKIHRIDVDAGPGAYNIPPDNPFVGMAGAKPEIWAYGLRNPWRWSFDRETGELWVGDVGQNTWEEVDRVEKGGNYGWNTCEGFHRQGSTTQLCETAGLSDPVVEHGRGEAQSITGGYVYRGTAMPSLVGTYIYGDYATGNIWALVFDADNKPTPTLLTTVAAQSLVSFGQGNDGEIYTVQINGTISKLVPSAPPPPDDFPQQLSQTGCFDPTDPTKTVAGVIPYEVNSVLWSDGAVKQRFLAIPDGAQITVTDDDDWDLPIGSVVIKSFIVDDQRIETRLFMRHDDGGWGGYTYEWNDEGTEATLLPAGKLRTLATTTWAYPSRSQCMQCHSKAAGGTIGLETAQLNRDAVYPSTNRIANQLATLDHIGLFATPLPSAGDAPRLSDPAGSDSLEDRARSYLHANCAHCHRPMGGGQGMLDLRYVQSFADTVSCNADNTQGEVGGATKLIVPGSPDDSILSKRMHAGGSKRMPPVGVSITDPVGTMVVDDWISSLSGCP